MKKLAMCPAIALAFLLGGIARPAWSGVDHGSFMGFPVVLLKVDGEVVQIGHDETPPIVVDGRTMVPLRLLGELLGVRFEWDQESRTVGVMTREPEKPVQTARMGESLTVRGITCTLDSVSYDDSHCPTVIFTLENNASGPLSGQTHIRLTINDPTYQAEYNHGPVRVPNPGWVYPGEMAEFVWFINQPRPDLIIKTVTVECVLYPSGDSVQWEWVALGTWIVED